jgi:formate/nitrite transporter FocA (FNT family)
MVWLLCMAAWLAYAKVNPDMDSSISTAVIVMSIAVIGFVDSVWNGFIPATLQTYFPIGNETPCAMAAIRICYSLGFSIQQVMSIMLGPTRLTEQALLLALFLSFSSGSLYYLHSRVCSLDGKMR